MNKCDFNVVNFEEIDSTSKIYTQNEIKINNATSKEELAEYGFIKLSETKTTEESTETENN